MALRTHSSACDASTISPLRIPRAGDWPRPTMFSEPSAVRSPTTAQIFDVPISRPTMMFESSNIFPPVFYGVEIFWNDRRRNDFRPANRDIVRHRQIERDNNFIFAHSQIVNFPPA